MSTNVRLRVILDKSREVECDCLLELGFIKLYPTSEQRHFYLPPRRGGKPLFFVTLQPDDNDNGEKEHQAHEPE